MVICVLPKHETRVRFPYSANRFESVLFRRPLDLPHANFRLFLRAHPMREMNSRGCACAQSPSQNTFKPNLSVFRRCFFVEEFIEKCGYRIAAIMRPCQGRNGGSTPPTRSSKITSSDGGVFVWVKIKDTTNPPRRELPHQSGFVGWAY